VLEHGCTVVAQKPSSSHHSNQEKKTLKPKWCWFQGCSGGYRENPQPGRVM